MAIVWTDTMSTGVAELDAQHKELIRMVNSLSDAMQAGQGKEEIGKILTFAGQYAQQHFRFEEGFFERYHCPSGPANKAGHEEFIKRFTELMHEFHAQGATFTLMMEIYNELATWLVQHILKVDTKLRTYVSTRP